MEGIGALQVILFLLGFGSILFLAYITTKVLAGKTSRAMKGKYIQVVETVNLGLDKRIHLVRAGEQYVLLAASSKSIEFLTAVNIDEDIEKEENDGSARSNFDFRAIFDKYINLNTNRKGSAGQQFNENREVYPDDESKFRENLGRLKSIIQKEKQVEKNENEGANEK